MKCDLFETVKAKVRFELHQVYEERGSCEQLVCKKCKCDKLEIGIGSYFTVARCPKCRSEECIHEG